MGADLSVGQYIIVAIVVGSGLSWSQVNLLTSVELSVNMVIYRIFPGAFYFLNQVSFFFLDSSFPKSPVDDEGNVRPR